jgi:ATP-dependent DNA helicase RecQ
MIAPMTPTHPSNKPAHHILQSVFGYEQFRPQQGDIVEQLIGGGDALVLMPTGGGKSLCYQIPAIVRQGVGIVVSPLIALMQDQVDALRRMGCRPPFSTPPSVLMRCARWSRNCSVVSSTCSISPPSG